MIRRFSVAPSAGTRKKSVAIAVLAMCTALLAAADASAQRWGRPSVPRLGACFYENVNFGGRYFCSELGQSEAQVGPDANDTISSIRIFGDAEVVVFKDKNYEGSSRVFTSSVSDLRSVGFNDLVTSYRIGRRGQYGGRFGSGQFGAGPEGGSFGRPQITRSQAQAMVREGYRSILGRDADPSGLQSWTQRVLDNGWTQRELNRELMTTDEYREKHRR